MSTVMLLHSAAKPLLQQTEQENSDKGKQRDTSGEKQQTKQHETAEQLPKTSHLVPEAPVELLRIHPPQHLSSSRSVCSAQQGSNNPHSHNQHLSWLTMCPRQQNAMPQTKQKLHAACQLSCLLNRQACGVAAQTVPVAAVTMQSSPLPATEKLKRMLPTYIILRLGRCGSRSSSGSCGCSSLSATARSCCSRHSGAQRCCN